MEFPPHIKAGHKHLHLLVFLNVGPKDSLENKQQQLKADLSRSTVDLNL